MVAFVTYRVVMCAMLFVIYGSKDLSSVLANVEIREVGPYEVPRLLFLFCF